jgi:hypothetical protein
MVVLIGLPGVGGREALLASSRTRRPRALTSMYRTPSAPRSVSSYSCSSPALPTIEPSPAPGNRLPLRSDSVTSET